MTAPAYDLTNDDTDAQDERIGQIIAGKWTLERLLGAGAAGAVYEARHQNGNRVAIKVALAKWARFPQMRERFLTEARAANRVEHRAVARVHDEGVAEDGSIFLVMDLLSGQTLGEYMEWNGLLSPEQVLLIAHEILEALAVAHEAGVLHRDIKPGNLFLNWDGRVLLVDFGIARLAESRSLTQVGVPIGTPAFMPPEQAAGRWHDVDERTDLWSLGATLFTLLTGEAVRQVQSVAEELQVAAALPARSVGSVRELPQPVVALVDKALSLDPADRFANATEMRDAVRDAMTSLGIALPTPAEMPGIRACMVLVPANDCVPEERHPSGIRLQLCESTIPTIEPEQWARKVKPRFRFIRNALIPLAVAAAAFSLWQPSYAGWQPLYDAVQQESLRAGRGAMAQLKSMATSVVEPFAAGRQEHAQRARAAMTFTAQLAESLPSVIPTKPPPTVLLRQTKSKVTTPAATSPEPDAFDPLAARL